MVQNVEDTNQNHQPNKRKFYIVQMVHTRLAAARLLLRFASGKGHYPFPEAEMASKYSVRVDSAK